MIASLSVLARTFSISPWLFLVASIPQTITGGVPTLTALIFSYVSDVCQPETRSFRTGLTQIAIILGSLAGSLSSGELVKFTSSSIIFTISSVSVLIAILYLVFFVKETVRNNVTHEGRCGLKELCQLNRFQGIREVVFQQRTNVDTVTIWLCLFAFGLMAFASNGAGTVFYLFVREQLDWGIQEFTFYNATSTIVMGSGGVIALFFCTKLFHVTDTILGAVGFFSGAIETAIIAFAVASWQMYLSIFISVLKNLSYVTCRTVLTNLVSDLDIGKINALMTSVEAIFGLVGTFVYTMVYNKTITWYPGSYNFISVAVNLLNGIFLL